MVAERWIQEDDPEREPAEEIREPVADPIASFERFCLDADQRENEIHPGAHGDSREEREDREDGVEGKRHERADDGPPNRGDGCASAFAGLSRGFRSSVSLLWKDMCHAPLSPLNDSM